MTQVLKAVNATKKVATKKVAKVLTQEQKDAIAKKRALNPQFANLQSAKRKVENLEYKKDLQNQCKVAINYLLKNEAKYLPLLKQVVRTSKSGLYSPYFAEQTIQKIVKLKLNDGKSFEHSLRDLKK